MKRVAISERPDWKTKAENAGFTFHTMHGEPYWDETSAYCFTMKQIENDIEDPTTQLHAMCRDAVDHIVRSEELMERLGIPVGMMDFVAQSWRSGEQEIYGRFDLSYDGAGCAKMLEYNADTPTSLYEAAWFQWEWLEDNIRLGHLPDTVDQFNSIYDRISDRFASMFPMGTNIHFASVAGSDEDYGTVETMAWMAKDAGMVAHYTPIDKIGITEAGQFADQENRVMGVMFKLYPWEDMLRDDFAVNIPTSGCRLIEPAWKALVSNKGILPVLWKLFEGHPNLLPAFFIDDMHGKNPLFNRAADALERGSVRKPIFSREGSSITITQKGSVVEASSDTTYDRHQMVVQQYHPLPLMDGFRPVIGAWVVGETCVGLGIREDQSRITQDLSRFKPHFILD